MPITSYYDLRSCFSSCFGLHNNLACSSFILWFLTVYNLTLFYRKNQVFEVIPDRVPEFPLKKFEKVSGEAFFVDENLLVYIDSLKSLSHSFRCRYLFRYSVRYVVNPHVLRPQVSKYVTLSSS